MSTTNAVEDWPWGVSALFQGCHPPSTHIFGKKTFGCEQPKVQTFEVQDKQCKPLSKN